jgi:nucleoside-diphosphate kinase
MLKFDGIFEKTIVIVKPDGVQRGLVGNVVKRLEEKGLKIVGLKMAYLNENQLREHYAHLVEKPFYPGLEAFMKSCPVIILCVEGKNAVKAVRTIAGVTRGYEADAGTIRGDLSMGVCNVVHCSDEVENAKAEVLRFFKEEELFEYNQTSYLHVYMDDERV